MGSKCKKKALVQWCDDDRYSTIPLTDIAKPKDRRQGVTTNCYWKSGNGRTIHAAKIIKISSKLRNCYDYA